MSGFSPIGYELKEKKLVIDEKNAEKVKIIFEKYLEREGVPELKRYLDDNEIKTRSGLNFSKGNLYKILANQAYIGKVAHKGVAYEGEHKAIIDCYTFDKTQKLLSENRIKEKSCVNSVNPSLLAGKLFDDNGNYMSPSHSNKKGRRYRYYISQAIIQFRKQEAGSISKIPAGEIEKVIIEKIKTFLSDTKKIHKYLENYDIDKQKDLLMAVKSLKTEFKHKLNSVFIRTNKV